MGFAKPVAFACFASGRTAVREPPRLALHAFVDHSFMTSVATHLHQGLAHLPSPIDHDLDATLSSVSHTIEEIPSTLTSLWDATTLQMADASYALPLQESFSLEDQLTVEMEEMSLSALGHDILLFLAASVLVDPLGKILGVTPVLLYLVLGFVAGPYGLSLFTAGTEVNSEIGDFGILFLLFVEGLNLSPERLKALGNFFSLGAAQLLLSVAFIFFGLFLGGPFLFPIVQDVRIPIDADVIFLLEKPVIAFSIASAGALSSSAFVLPILKEKGWEKGADGIAALSILLLQDLAVAPLLVILPLIAQYDQGVGSTATATQDPMALTVLIAKATIGFGGVLAVASLGLRQIFQVVARFGSAQTFVAASLLVASGMGIIADTLGLSSTTGAFAAGVLLAESGYRAQIEADIKPFEGILLGVFFVTAGASLDPQTVIDEWPTLVAGISTFIAVKFGIVLAAGQFALGLTRADAVRVAFLLAGGGEFAFVVFKLASNLDVLPDELGKLLIASVIISMSLTPLLGELAGWAGDKLEKIDSAGAYDTTNFEDYDVNLTDDEMIRKAFESFDEDGSGAISASELRQVLIEPGTTDAKLSEEAVKAIISRFDDNGDGELQFDEFAELWTAKRRPAIQDLQFKSTAVEENSMADAIVVCGYGEVAQQFCASLDRTYVTFSQDPNRISLGVLNGAKVVYGNGASPSLVRSVGVEKPSAIVVAYATEARCLEATLRLHEAFPDSPIYVRADRLDNVDALVQAGATKVVVETRKVSEAFQKLVGLDGAVKDRILEAIKDISGKNVDLPYSESELTELAYVCDMTPEELGQLFELFSTSLSKTEDGNVQLAELRDELMRRRTTPLDDKTLKDWMGYDEALSKWVTGEAETKFVSFPEFVKFAAGKL